MDSKFSTYAIEEETKDVATVLGSLSQVILL